MTSIASQCDLMEDEWPFSHATSLAMLRASMKEYKSTVLKAKHERDFAPHAPGLGSVKSHEQAMPVSSSSKKVRKFMRDLTIPASNATRIFHNAEDVHVGCSLYHRCGFLREGSLMPSKKSDLPLQMADSNKPWARRKKPRL